LIKPQTKLARAPRRRGLRGAQAEQRAKLAAAGALLLLLNSLPNGGARVHKRPGG
jgi:hypothetical protein